MPAITAWECYKARLATCGFIYSDLVPIALSTWVARKWLGEPLWVLVIGPPSMGKTLPVTLAKNSPDVISASSITPAGLVTAYGGSDHDKSLLAQLNGKNLIIKDFGTIMSLGWEATMAVMAILREAFDGQISRKFAHVDRNYTLKFTIIAASTNSADTHAGMSQHLGERFLRCRPTPINVPYPSPPEVEVKAREITREFLMGLVLPVAPPVPQDGLLLKAAVVASKLRTLTLRDSRHHEIVEVPHFEQPYRLVHQLEKLKAAVEFLTGDNALAECLALRLAMDCIPPRRRIIFNLLLDNPTMETPAIIQAMTLGGLVIRGMLDDMYALGLVTKQMLGYPKTWQWSLAKEIHDEVTEVFGRL